MRTRFNPYIVFEGDDKGGGGGGSTPPNNDPSGEIAKAYEKLRTAEAERDRLKAENRSLKQNADAKTVEQLQARVTELEGDLQKAHSERDEAKTNLNQFQTRNSVEKAARDAGFRSPGVATDLLFFRKTDLSDDGKIKSALDGLAKEDPGMVAAAPPSGGPINPQNGNESDSAGNSGFNAAIRSAAGRPSAA